MRLIDADEVIEELEQLKEYGACASEACGYCKYFQDCEDGNMSEIFMIDKVIEIMKGGGIEDTEEQGALVKLPCKVGDSVFIIVGKDISKQGIRKVEISDNGIIFKTNRRKRIFNVSEFGKTVFLIREEAENKLEEMKNEQMLR